MSTSARPLTAEDGTSKVPVPLATESHAVPTSSNALVTKSNALIKACYSMSLLEQRIILSCAAQLDGRKPISRNKNTFTLRVDDFARTWRMKPNSAYGHLEKAANKLYERDIRRIEGEKRQRMRWVHKAVYMKGEGAIELSFSPDLFPYLSQLNKNFTKYRICEITGLGSAHAIRLYENLVQFRDKGWLRVSLHDFREMLELTAEYPRFSNFSQRVINPAVKEVTKKTPLDVEFEAIKQGRRVVMLDFRFREKPQLEIPDLD